MTPYLQNKTFFCALHERTITLLLCESQFFVLFFLIHLTPGVIMSSDFFLCSCFVYFASHTAWDVWNTDAAVLFGECPGSCVCNMYLFEEI